VGKRGSVFEIELPADAPEIVAKSRYAAGKFDARLVEIGDPAFGIGRVDGGGQVLQDIAIIDLPPTEGLDRAVEDLHMGSTWILGRHAALPLSAVRRLPQGLGRTPPSGQTMRLFLSLCKRKM
jgi:hypothetical protein